MRARLRVRLGSYWLYLLGAHARRLQMHKERRPKPILGMVLDGDKVFEYIYTSITSYTYIYYAVYTSVCP